MKQLRSKIVLTTILTFAFLATSSGVAFALTPSQVPSSYSCNIWSGDLVTCAVNFVLYLFSQIMGLLIAVGVWFIKIGMSLTSTVYSSQATQNGFAATLGVANLTFVIAIIVIAIATIFRSETYGYKKALWRLVAMAILVNFGLVITAPIVNFANGMTNYFVKNIQGTTSGTDGFTSFSNKLMDSTNAQALDVPPANTNTNGTSIAGAFFQTLLSLVFIIIFKGLIAMTFMLLGILLFVRYIYLVVLMIMLPLAWAMWIFPNFRGQFSEWWKKFIHWTFFPVAAMFFVWLAVQIQISFAGSLNATGPSTAIVAATGSSILDQLVNSLVVIGVMIGGLMASSKLAGSAGSWAVAQGKSASKSVSGYVGRKTKSGTQTVSRYASDRLRGAGKQYNGRETTTWLQRQGSKLQSVPGLRGVGASLARSTSPDTIKKSRQEDIQKYVDDNLKSLTNDGIVARANSKTALVNPTIAAALAQELARRDLTGRVNGGRMTSFVNAADRLGNLDKVTSNRPDLMPPRTDVRTGITETREQATARAVNSAKGEIIQASADVFNRTAPAGAMTVNEVERAALSLTPSQLAALGSDTTAPGYQNRQNNLTATINHLVNTIPGLKVMDPTSGRAVGIDSTVLGAAALTRPELANLEKIVKHMESSSNWGTVLN